MRAARPRSACVLVLLTATCFAASAPAVQAEEVLFEGAKKRSTIFIPILFYTPETKLGAGASMIRVFRDADIDPTSRPSTVQPTFIYTQKNQTIVDLQMDIYWAKETYRLGVGPGYIKFPDEFYGIGPETTDSMKEDYTPETFFLDVSFFRKIRHSLRLGMQYELRHGSILEREENGLLDTESVVGSRGGTASGIGLSLDLDTRDNIFYPAGGSYHRVSATFFDGSIGSDFVFKRYVVNLRKFVSLSETSILAFQGLARFSSGDPPFYMMAEIGGQDLVRGYYSGRYRDRHALVIQAEHRVRVTERWGMVAFASAGAVANELDAFELREAKPSAGLGIRYLFTPSESINVRADFGFGKDSSGFYITLGEAF